MSPEEKELRNSIRKMIEENAKKLKESFDDEDEDNLGIFSDYDEEEAFGGEAMKAAMADIKSSEGEFEPLGKSQFEKNLDVDQLKSDLNLAKLNLPSEKEKLKPLKKALDARFKQEKMFGKGSMNESHKIDVSDPLIDKLKENGFNPGLMPWGSVEIDIDTPHGKETISYHKAQITSDSGTENLYTANLLWDSPFEGGGVEREMNVFFGTLEDAIKFAKDKKAAHDAEMEKMPKTTFTPTEPEKGPKVVGKIDLTGMDTKRFEEGTEEVNTIPEKILNYMYYSFGAHFGDADEIEINAGDKYGVGKQMVRNVGAPSYNSDDKTMDIPIDFTYNEMDERSTIFKVPYFVWKKVKEGTWKGKPQGRFTQSIELNEGHVNPDSKIDRPKDAEGQPITLKARVEHLKSGTPGRVVRFVIGDDGKINVKVDWIQNSLMGMKLLPVVPATDIVVRDSTRVVREEEGEGEAYPEQSRYMFFGNLQQIKRQAEILLGLDEEEINNILENGHDWAQDHVATAKESMDQVFDFLMNELKGENADWEDKVEKEEELDEDSLAFRHKAGQREKERKNIPLGKHSPHSQAAINENYDYSKEELSHHFNQEMENNPEWFVDDNGEIQVDTPDSISKTYTYTINLDERGEFNADVRDESGKTVFDIDGYDIFEDGFMKHKHDHEGLKKHLISLGIINPDDKLECAETGEVAENKEVKPEVEEIVFEQLKSTKTDYTYMHPSSFTRNEINETHKKLLNLVKENYMSFDVDGGKNYYWLTDKGKKLDLESFKKIMKEGKKTSEYKDAGFLRGKDIEDNFS
jgi:predicted transcriptional regulator